MTIPNALTHTEPACPARLDLLDAGRIVAVIGVMAYHYLFNGIINGKIASLSTLGPFAHIAKYGYLGVELFFLISGYVIFFSASGSTARRFALSRTLRLYPAFWFAVILTSCIAFFWGGAKMSVTPIQIFASLSMLGPLFGQPFVDGVYWTLVYELIFYAAVFVILFIHQAHRLDTIFTIWPFIMLAATLLGLGSVPLLGGYYSYFASGALFAIIKRSGNRHAACALIVCMALNVEFSLRVMAIKQIETGVSFSSTIVAFIVGLFYLFFLTSMAGSALRLPFVRLLAGLTYPLYLIHAHIGYMLLSRIAAPSHAVGPYIATLALVVALAVFMHFIIERRLRPVWGRLFTFTLGNLLKVAETKLATWLTNRATASG